jgi:hypothetical protein
LTAAGAIVALMLIACASNRHADNTEIVLARISSADEPQDIEENTGEKPKISLLSAMAR